MARARNLKPGFFRNEYLAQLSPLARILYEGLWCWADREGRLEDRPLRLKADVLPYDDCDIDQLLDSLTQSPDKFITRYTINGRRYIQVNNFSKHQNPHHKEPPSSIPSPQFSANTEKTETRPRQDRDCTRSSRADSLNPLTDSLNLIPSNLKPESGASTDESEDEPDETEPSVLNKKQQIKFDAFWKAYPKKKSKGNAEKAFKKINPDEQLLETMISTIERAKKSEDWSKEEGRYIPHPATWLNGKGWLDEYKTASNQNAKTTLNKRFEEREYQEEDIEDLYFDPTKEA